jgi:hypothetical protein
MCGEMLQLVGIRPDGDMHGLADEQGKKELKFVAMEVEGKAMHRLMP